MRVALVYDRVNKWGGAERVLLALHEMFPEAPLYTAVYNSESTPWAKVFPKIIPSFLQKFPFAKTRHDLYAPLMPLAFESFDFSEYDIVISITSEAAKGIITKPSTIHICYCLTPTRYLWSGYKDYFTSARRPLAAPIISYLKKWDLVAAQRPDVMVGISRAVVKRIKKYYGRSAQLVYPPVELKVPPVRQAQGKQVSKGEYFLVVSRLVPYKRVDLVIDVFNRLSARGGSSSGRKLPLVIVGTGSEEGSLRRQSRSKNTVFVGQVDDAELASYYQGCKALIFPQEEDFGITAVEAQAFGKPVIAYRGGGALDTVVDGNTGIFFDRQTPESLASAIKKFGNLSFDKKLVEENARKFSKEKFFEEFARLVSRV
ncbi:MAG: glycosyltransferase [bacterium]|nr:glycosyltransferase [bacterium]